MRLSVFTAAVVAFVFAVSLAPALAEDGQASAQGHARTGGVEVLDTGGGTPVPCDPVDTGGRFVEGGCSMLAHDFDVDLTVRTALGAMAFGRCVATFDVTLSDDGRIWLDRLRIGGTPPCGDIWICAPQKVIDSRKNDADPPPLAQAYPWTGKIVSGAGGSFAGHVDVCFETCLGRFEGRMPLAFERDGQAWKMRASNAGLGTGGLAMDGDWKLDPADGFDIRPRAVDEKTGRTASPPPAVATSDPAATFAPLVVLPADESRLPISAAAFVGNSSLTWSNDPCFTDRTLSLGAIRRRLGRDAAAPATDPARLGGRRPYRARPLRPDCRGHESRSYTTTQRTHPYGAGRAAGLRPGEGFHLDLLSKKQDGQARIVGRGSEARVRGAPVYVDRTRERVGAAAGVRLEYWLLFGRQSPRPKAAYDLLAHEGDWERVSVLLRRAGPSHYTPVSVRFHAWGRARDVPWSRVDTSSGDAGPATHPVVHLARGSHAPYPTPGARTVRVRAWGDGVAVRDTATACPDCSNWLTWNRLRPLRAEPWYGYGGAWGARYLSESRSGVPGPPFAR